MCDLFHVATEKCPLQERKKKKKIHGILNSVSKICPGSSIGKILMMCKYIDNGGSRIWV